MKTRLNAFLRRSSFAVGVVSACRGAVSDLRVLAWSVTRKAKIRSYFETAQSKKVHLGASRNHLPGWLNTDSVPTDGGVIYLDVTKPFPLRDDSVDYIFAEHLIEHVDYDGGQLMLRECWRVLKPDGRIRIATPDLEVLIGLHGREKTHGQQRYVEWMISRCLPKVEDCKDVFVINNAFRAWGHRFLYDRETLFVTMSGAGFRDIALRQPGKSADPHLNGLEAHGKEIGNEEANQFETFVVEGRAAKRER
jgi:predicted SAM-dependent methyltransferase